MPNNSDYWIMIEGLLDEGWAEWFDDVAISYENGDTVLKGCIDQATLHGLLKTIRDLGLTILVVQRIDSETQPNGGVE